MWNEMVKNIKEETATDKHATLQNVKDHSTMRNQMWNMHTVLYFCTNNVRHYRHMKANEYKWRREYFYGVCDCLIIRNYASFLLY